jgi:hypothetical protein
MINYYLSIDGVFIKVDSDKQTITNVMNLGDKKMFAHFTDPAYYKMIVDTQISSWNISDQTIYDLNRSQVITSLNGI